MSYNTDIKKKTKVWYTKGTMSEHCRNCSGTYLMKEFDHPREAYIWLVKHDAEVKDKIITEGQIFLDVVTHSVDETGEFDEKA